MGGANLEGADLSHADLVEAYLGGAKAKKADFTSANLEEANVEEADLTEACFEDAQLSRMGATAATFVRARMGKADLSLANLVRANLQSADLRKANLDGAKLDGTVLTGARVAGITVRGAHPEGAIAEWVDVGVDDSVRRASAEEAKAILSGKPLEAAPEPANRRYFGRGDVLRFASLEFGAGANVEIDSRFEQCTIAIGEGTELVIGPEGVLAGCNITGGGNITVSGHFFEGKTPGIVGPRKLVVTAGGAVVGAVEQAAEATAFAFEPGCRLRMKITQAKTDGRNG
jgi:hypothetical protein